MRRPRLRPPPSLTHKNNMENKPTAADALRVLDQATQPQNLANLNRMDFINVQNALQILADFVNEHTPKPAEEPKKRGRPPGGAFGVPAKP